MIPALRTAVAGAAARSPQPVRLLEALGAHTLADSLDIRRYDGDVVPVALPPAPGAWRATRIKAFRQHGHDQCVEALHQGGWWGFERPLPDVLLACVRTSSGLVLDVGANTGVYSLVAASVPGREVHAFEAFPPVAAMLRRNLALNACGARVRVVDAAVADRVGTLPLYIPEASGQTVETSASVEAGFKGGAGAGGTGHVIEVPSVTLDSHWTALGCPQVGTVKVDVEGAEHKVLSGAGELLTRSRPVVFYEVLPGADTDVLEQVRRRYDYVDVRLSAQEAVAGDVIGFDDSGWNHGLVPAERLEGFLDLVGRLGLATVRLA